MTNRQFHFSLTVGIALAIVGGVILSKATVGLSLIVLGAAIAALALLTRFTAKSQQAVRSSTQAKHDHNRAPAYRAHTLAE